MTDAKELVGPDLDLERDLVATLNDLLQAIEALEGYAMAADRDAEHGEGAHQSTARQAAGLLRRLGERHRRDAREVREMLRTTIGEAAPRSVG